MAEASKLEGCVGCHQETPSLSPFHDPARLGCVACHFGNPASQDQEVAHRGLIAFPGNLDNAKLTCGKSGCHQDLVPLVENSVMNRVEGMVSVTREVFGQERPYIKGEALHQQLSMQGADSYLRKLCVSCHLGNPRNSHHQDLRQRGGGCNACHLKTFPAAKDSSIASGKLHPRLTIKVEDDRCFGCHSRSGRISLNYVGLAEVEAMDQANRERYGTLYDGRLVIRHAPDVHSQANMACVDCHTRTGVMGLKDRKLHQRQLDVQCVDCHQQPLNTKPLGQIGAELLKSAALQPEVFFTTADSQVVVTQRFQTPLFHVQLQEEQAILHTKLSGKKLLIPAMKSGPHHNRKGHERLNCQSCHAAWAPQCYGCHIQFDPNQTQFDHLLKRQTPGRWIESRWLVQSGLPALGVNQNNRIVPFVPGMNLTLELGQGKPVIHKRTFASIAPHTTQRKSRSCASCHRNEAALGIIQQRVSHPSHPEWQTDLGWFAKGSPTPALGNKQGERSLNRLEIERILNAIIHE